MQAAVVATARRLRLAAVLFLGVLAVSAATAPGASAAPCNPITPRICVAVVASSGTVTPSTATLPKFVSYDVKITNEATSTATHVTLTDALTDLGTIVSATPTTGTCTSTTASATCAFGSVPSNGGVTVTILVRAPDGEGQVTNAASVSFDEGINDNPANTGKQDTVTASASSLVTTTGPAVSLVPSNTDVQLDTDTTTQTTTPGNPNIGRANVPASIHAPITASLEEVPGTTPCPKKEICRSGAWLHATIPGTFSPALEFTLHWNKSLVPKSQSTKNLDVLKTECLTGCPVVVISRRCTATSPPTPGNPCLTNVEEDANEFRATVLSSENGYMR